MQLFDCLSFDVLQCIEMISPPLCESSILTLPFLAYTTSNSAPSEGGTAYHAMTESYPLKKALPGLASIELDNWGD